MHRTTMTRRVTLSGLAAMGLVALGATPALAHVTITPSSTAAGATAVLRVEIPHGCEESATTAISIRMPDELADVTASGTDRWAVDQAPDSLTYTTGTPLPDGEHAEVEFSVRLPDDAGAELVFPVIQQCEEGEAAWTEVAEQGEHAEHGADELDRPAPVVVVTAGDAAKASAPAATPSASAETPGETAGEPTEAASAPAVGDERDPLIAYGAAGVLVAGGLAGGAVLLNRRRRR